MEKHNIPKHIYFVRHGESEANVTQVPGGYPVKLTEKGEKQADIVGERFARIPTDVIISSPFVRARQTAEYIHKHTNTPITESDLFIERQSPSEVIGKPVDHPVRVEVAEIERSNLLNGTQNRYSDEELFHEVMERADKAIEFLKEREEASIAVVTHGLFLKFVVFRMALGDHLTPQIYHEILHNFSTWNTAISYVVYGDDQRFHVCQWNDVAHLGELLKGETRNTN